MSSDFNNNPVCMVAPAPTSDTIFQFMKYQLKSDQNVMEMSITS